jgi:hypothetical protein
VGGSQRLQVVPILDGVATRHIRDRSGPYIKHHHAMSEL